MKNIWRLTTDLVALFFDGQSIKTGEIFQNVVAFCPVEKKIFKTNLIKLMDRVPYKEFNLSNNNFQIRINSSGLLEVKSDQFPDPLKYYTISNYNIFGERLSKEIGYLVSNLSNDKGNFDKYNFEIAFSNNDDLSIRFICKELDIYNTCLDELNRRTKCELFKKTKTFIPGHKYESLDESIIYLGKFKSSMLMNKNDMLLAKDALDYEDVYLYIDADSIKDTEKTVKNIFENRYFSSIGSLGIKEIRKLKPMVDSGEILINDIDSSFNLRNYCLKLINNSISSIVDSTVKIPINNDDSLDITIYKKEFTIKDILLSLTYFSENKYDKIDDQYIKETINNFITNIIRVSTLRELNKWSAETLKNRSVDNIVTELRVRLIYEIFSQKWDKVLIDYLNYCDYIDNDSEIDFNEKLKDEIINCNKIINNSLSIDFEDYCKLSSIWLYNMCHYSQQRENSCSYRFDITTIEDLFGKSEFTETLKTICREAINNSGDNITDFMIKNVGTRKSPLYYVSMTISLEDIIRYYKGIGNIPDDVKYTIKHNKFYTLKIDLDLETTKDIK